jgi:hypothetical protein
MIRTAVAIGHATIAAPSQRPATAAPGGAATLRSQADNMLWRMSAIHSHVLGRFADLVLSQAQRSR